MTIAAISPRALAVAASAGLAMAIASCVIPSGAVKAAPPTCNGEPATIVGTDGGNRIVGTRRDDVIVGLGGDDHIDGAGGHDVICGGDGNDTLLGGAGADELLGGRGNDVLSGGPGGVRYWTGKPTPWEALDGGPGRDALDRRDLRWGSFAGDACFLGSVFVACPGPRPKGLVE